MYARAPWSSATCETERLPHVQEKLDANVFRRVVLGLPVGSADHAPELHPPDDAVSDGVTPYGYKRSCDGLAALQPMPEHK